jgi:cell wall-associated NlpC family hydrolase
VSVGGLVAHVGVVLGRAHALFGDPPRSGGLAASGTGSVLADAGDVVRSGRAKVAALSGRFATDYGVLAAGMRSALDGLGGTDRQLSGQLDEAVGSDRGGRAASGSVVNGAAADAAALAPFSNMPAGEKAMIVALRARVAQQQRVVAAYRARDARMAALVRSMGYAGRVGAGGGIGMPGGGESWSPPGRPRFSGAGATRFAHRRAGAVPPGPGGVAVRAALSRQGRPYVWGAKGPNRFDCSGLTQWAWRQAGVLLGGDTYTQINQGVPVPPGRVRAGDLIFPRYAFDGRGPEHVQLAISPTEVIHAPQAGDVVRIAPMPLSYVARRPVALGWPTAENVHGPLSPRV